MRFVLLIPIEHVFEKNQSYEILKFIIFFWECICKGYQNVVMFITHL